MTLTLTNYENYLVWVGLVHAPLEGLRLSDLPKIEAAKKAFVCERFDGDRTVELEADLAPILRAAWGAFPLGKIARTDDLPAAVERVTKQLEVKKE